MNKMQSSHVIGTAVAPKRMRTILVGGANRGAEKNLPALADLNRASSSLALHVVYVDPVPGRASALKEEAERLGLSADAIEGRIEEVGAEGHDLAPQILSVDRASAIASALRETRSRARSTLAYLLIRMPSRRLWALRSVLEEGDEVARNDAIAFYERLATFTERKGSNAVVGSEAEPAHILAEPAIRAWFAEHTRANIPKLVAGIEPVSNAFEVTMDGRTTLPLHVVLRDTWSEPSSLAEEVVANPSSPLRRGVEFVVAEVTPHGIRFHEARRRSDDRVTVRGGDTLDRAAVDAREEADAIAAQAKVEAMATEAKAERETSSRSGEVGVELARSFGLALAATATALTRAQRETIGRANPVRTTD